MCVKKKKKKKKDMGSIASHKVLTSQGQNISPGLHGHCINLIRFGSDVACRSQWKKDSTAIHTAAGTRHVTTEQDQEIAFKSMNALFLMNIMDFFCFFSLKNLLLSWFTVIWIWCDSDRSYCFLIFFYIKTAWLKRLRFEQGEIGW